MTDLLGEELAMKVAAWINSAPLLRHGRKDVIVCTGFYDNEGREWVHVCIDTHGGITVNGQKV